MSAARAPPQKHVPIASASAAKTHLIACLLQKRARQAHPGCGCAQAEPAMCSTPSPEAAEALGKRAGLESGRSARRLASGPRTASAASHAGCHLLHDLVDREA